MTLTKKSRTILENAADHIYRHVQVDEESGIVTRATEADAQTHSILRAIIRNSTR